MTESKLKKDTKSIIAKRASQAIIKDYINRYLPLTIRHICFWFFIIRKRMSVTTAVNRRNVNYFYRVI